MTPDVSLAGPDRVRFGRNRLDLRQLRFEESHPMVAKAAELVRSGES